MHVPTGFCSPTVCLVGAGLAAGALLLARRLDRDQPARLTGGGLAALGAAVFALQMLNTPVAAGTSGHLVGGVLLGVLAGPWRGMLAMGAILAVQAVLFADGGLDALGVNIVLMGALGVLSGWAITRLLARDAGRLPSAAAAGLAAVATTLAAAIVCAVALAASGTSPLATALPAMLAAHLPIAMFEAAATALAVGVLVRPAGAPALGFRLPTGIALAACVAAPFASALPDGLDSAAIQLGIDGRAQAWAAPLAGYAVPGLAGSASVVLAALIGALVVGGLLAWRRRVQPAPVA